ncbi:hypothetical protein MNBD_GAMMA20-1070 [hydrothermal vent metagenome]|uniref:Uncharacterized protein n=1 Tax=hydrothermal vent metagenome TaxID=652676 RepID=A0A3B1A6H7_9ZZZZ
MPAILPRPAIKDLCHMKTRFIIKVKTTAFFRWSDLSVVVPGSRNAARLLASWRDGKAFGSSA